MCVVCGIVKNAFVWFYDYYGDLFIKGDCEIPMWYKYKYTSLLQLDMHAALHMLHKLEESRMLYVYLCLIL